MADSQTPITETELHSGAEQQIKQYSEEFTTTLVYQSQLLAYRRNHDLVLAQHVEDAHTIIIRDGVQRNRFKELRSFIGSALFGAFVPGFITAVSTNDTPQIVLFVILGLTGLSMFLWEFRQGQ